MEKYKINNNNYVVVKDYKNGFDYDEVVSKMTDYFDGFDYVCGDWAYGKLRLKGFYNHDNKLRKEFNDIDGLDSYLENNCAREARYFVIKKD